MGPSTSDHHEDDPTGVQHLARAQLAPPRLRRGDDRGAAGDPADAGAMAALGVASAIWPVSACSGSATSPASPAPRPRRSRTPGTTVRATKTSSTSSAPEALVEALDSTFRIIEGCLDRWTLDMLDEELRRPEWDGSWVHTRGWVDPAGLQPRRLAHRRVERVARERRAAADRRLGLYPCLAARPSRVWRARSMLVGGSDSIPASCSPWRIADEVAPQNPSLRRPPGPKGTLLLIVVLAGLPPCSWPAGRSPRSIPSSSPLGSISSS